MTEHPATILDLVRRLDGYGEQTTVVVDRAETSDTISAADLASAARDLSVGLGRAGFTAGSRVAIVGEDSISAVAVRLGVWLSGAAIMPLTPESEPAAFVAQLQGAEVNWVFLDASAATTYAAALSEAGIRTYQLDPREPGAVVPSWRTLHKTGAPDPEPIAPETPAVILSEAAGETAPVILTQANLMAAAVGLCNAGAVRSGETLLCLLPLDRLDVLSGCLLATLYAGGTMVLASYQGVESLIFSMRDHRVAVLVAAPAIHKDLLADLEPTALPRARRGLKHQLADSLERHWPGVGGKMVFRASRRRVGPDLRCLMVPGQAPAAHFDDGVLALGLAVQGGYGPPQAAGWALLQSLRANGENPEEVGIAGLSLQYGPPDENGQCALAIHGRQVAGPFDDAGWCVTGDLGRRLDDGALQLSGSTSERLVRNGRTDYFGRIEARLGDTPVIRDIGVLEQGENLVACVVPDLKAIARGGSARVEDVVRVALEERSQGLPSVLRLSGTVILKKPLPRDSQGKLRRERLSAIFEAGRAGSQEAFNDVLSEADQALMANPDVSKVWDWLQSRYPAQALGLDFSPQLDLEIDSLDWLSIGMELEHRFGIRLNEEAMSRMLTLREFIGAVAAVGGATIDYSDQSRTTQAGPAPRIGTLSDQDRYWISPLTWGTAIVGGVIFFTGKVLMRLFFGNKVEGLEHLPKDGGYLIAVNHASDIDPLVVAASFDLARFRRNYWSGEITRLFGSPLARFLSRSVQIFPLDERAPGTSLAYARAVLEQGKSLVWFPESWRSPDGRLQRFLPGVGLLVAETGVPVVPARITGAFDAMPRGATRPRPHPIRIVYGPPVSAEELIARADSPTDYAGIATAVRDEVKKLPGKLPVRSKGQAASISRAPLIQRLRWGAEASIAWGLYGLLRMLPLDAASGFGGWVTRSIGPRLGITKRAKRNITRALPDLSATEVDSLIREMWENMGRTVGELAHLDKFDIGGPGSRIEFVGEDIVEQIRDDGKPAVAFAGHFANWELAALVAGQRDLPLSLIYREANNPYVEKLIQRCREPQKGRYIPKGANASRRITEAMRNGEHIGLMVDQKTNNGVPAPFFGRTAMTTPVLALCALNYDCPLMPAQVERLGGAWFRVTVHPPLQVEATGDRDADIERVTIAMNKLIEDWVRQHPGQWFWLHRRWPD